MSYDQKCEELAEHFLPSGTSRTTIETLAQRIQDAIEDELEEMVEGAILYSCRDCGKQCDIAPAPPARAVCPNCCEDHEYEYVRGARGHFCKHCGQERPADWFDES